MLAKTVWGEARGLPEDEQRLVAWTVFNRVTDSRFPDTIAGVITQRGQFIGYKAGHPVNENLTALCRTEAEAWAAGAEAPELEPYASGNGYLWFTGDGKHNYFREEY